MSKTEAENTRKRVVIIGAGFAGLRTAMSLGNKAIDVTIVDKRNFHLFQPLLYQVATGFLPPGDIATPIRFALSKYNNISVIHDEVIGIKLENQTVHLSEGSVDFDYLVVATGVTHSYFGNDSWEQHAPGLKTIEDAITIRTRILSAFEEAEKAKDLAERDAHLTFCIVGAGPTGVELAGALAELARSTLEGEFKNISPTDARIKLIEAGPTVLSGFQGKSSSYAREALQKLGVEVLTNTLVTDVSDTGVLLKHNNSEDWIASRNVIWAAGVKASSLSKILADELHVRIDRSGKILVNPDLTVSSFKNIFVAGDLASLTDSNGEQLPGVAPVAIQQGAYVGKSILQLQKNRTPKPFKYFDKGSMAVIGRGRAVAEGFTLVLRGFSAWVAWAIVHIYFLIEFENRAIVFFAGAGIMYQTAEVHG